jgi:hypothetical protein
MSKETVYATINGTTALALNLTHLKCHRADSQFGTYVEITGAGTRPDILAGVNSYFYDDATGDATKWYKWTAWGAVGGETGYSEAATGGTSAIIDIVDRKILAAYLSPTDLQAAWQEFEPYGINWTREGLKVEGNLPYAIGTDWNLVVAYVYTDDNGVLCGENLTSCVVTVKIYDQTKTLVKTKTNGSGVTLRSQATARASGGTRGEFVIGFENAEQTDASEDYTPGLYELTAEITWADDSQTLILRGKFAMERAY